MWLRRQWWSVKYFINGEMRRDKRERASWAKLAKKSLMKRMADDEREARRYGLKQQVDELVKHGYLQDATTRPYKGCMSNEHYELIMHNRVVQLNVEGHTIYEVNTKGMDAWEVDEFWAMLKDRSKLNRPKPIIREVLSDRFPQ
jgi:hypothetical protein